MSYLNVDIYPNFLEKNRYIYNINEYFFYIFFISDEEKFNSKNLLVNNTSDYASFLMRNFQRVYGKPHLLQ